MKPLHNPIKTFQPSQSLILGFLALTGSILLSTPTVWAQNSSPVAIVEDATQNAPVAAFEYLNEGYEVQLPSDATVVIGYLTSCRRETITGGTVKIGREQSVVVDGQITHEQVPCDGGQIDLTQDEVAASGVVVFRGPESEEVTIYSSTPAFTFAIEANVSSLEIERLDREEEVKRYAVSDGRVDLLVSGSILNSGGTYQVRYGDQVRRFHVVVYARKGGPLVGRVIQL